MSGKWYIRLLERMNISGREVTVFLLSLLLAFSIWVLYNLSMEYSSVLSVPVVAQSNIEGHSPVSSTSSVIAARCRTSGYNLVRTRFSLKRHPRTIWFAPEDMRHLGEDNFSISANELTAYVNDIFGDDIQLESMVSSSVQFRFPYENHKKVPVQLITLLDFKPQYMAIGQMRAAPDSVLVYGEPLHLDNVDRVYTEPLTLSEISSSVHGVAKIEVPAGIRVSTEEVSYSLDVTRYVEIKREIPISVRNVPSGRSVDVYPSSAQVTFRCPFPITANPTESVSFYIDYSDFAKSINGRCVPKASSIPSGIIDYSIDPQVFECIEKSPR